MSRRQAPRPKRGAEDFARSHYNEDTSSSKKVHFDTRNPAALAADAPEEDAVLDADVIGRRGAQVKRSAVNIDGYESDSSNEGFDARADAKAKNGAKAANGSKDEEDDDMFADIEEKQFADGDEDEDLRKEGKRRKEVRAADKIGDDDEDEPEIETSKSGGHVSANILLNPERYGRSAKAAESDSESSEDDEEGRAALEDGMDEELGAGSKKKHMPRLDAFNMKEERQEGAIDQNLNYVRKAADPDAVYDNWLEGTSKKEIRQAKEAHERRDRERRAKDQKDDQILTADILRNLIPHLEMGETVMEALARLGKGKPSKTQKVPKWKQKKKKATEMDVDDESAPVQTEEDKSEQLRRQTVEAITDAADRLMRRGQEDIYDQERELLTRLYKRETGEEWSDPSSTRAEDEKAAGQTKNWQYRWADGRDGENVHGPYDGVTMQAWDAAGYFGEGVEFRLVGDESSSWSRSAKFTSR